MAYSKIMWSNFPIRKLFLLSFAKVVFLFYPHTLTFRLKRPVYRGFNGEGKCEGKYVNPHALMDKPCHNSSCEPTATGRRSKKLTDCTDAHGVFDHGFFWPFFWCKGILNGFASVTACGCLGSDCPLMCSCIDCPVICRYLVYIYCPKESKCRHLQNPSKIPLSCQGTIKR